MSVDDYALIAPFYDLLHAGLTEDIAFALELAARHGGPILELGCGTGRILLPLAGAGYPIVGLDNSTAMLNRARQRLASEQANVRARAALVAADMTRLALAPNHFALALVPYNTFLHLEPAAAGAAVQAAARCLRPGGRLFMDLANPFAVEQAPADRLLSVEHLMTDAENLVLALAASRLYQAMQVLKITWIFDASPASGGPVQRTVVPVTYRYYFPHEIEMLLQQGGLQMEALYGDYDGGDFDEGAERLLVIARRPG
jgi:SAM-dependent methyltransferase